MSNYMTHGLPATATVTFTRVPAAGATITVNGVVATYQTDFSSRGLNVADVAESFAAWVNGSPDGYKSTHTATNPTGTFYAVYYGNVVRLVSRLPGAAGNAYTLATSDSATITVSAATFAGGANGGPTTAVLETGTTALTGIFSAITMVTDVTFTTLTGLGGDSVATHTFPALLTIYGPFTAVTLATGKAIIYT